LKVTHAGRQITVEVTPDGDGLVSHAGSALLAGVAGKTGLTRALSRVLGVVRQRRGHHDPGQVITDLAVMLADGGDCLADLQAVRDQAPLFGQVASCRRRFGSSMRSPATPTGLRGCAPRALGRARGRGSLPARRAS